MRAYKFIGETPEVFPTIVFAEVDEDGNEQHRTAVLEPGDVFTVDQAVDHPRLQPAGKATKDMDAAAVVPTEVAVTPDAPSETPTVDEAAAEPTTSEE